MDRALPVLTTIEPARTCVWMDAGMLAFRLCDRGFDCDHCPFDAAMRRDPHHHRRDDESATTVPGADWVFPSDRLYTSGHQWVQVVRSGRIRTGIDVYGARLLRGVEHVGLSDRSDEIGRGGLLCTVVLEAGRLMLATPLTGCLCGGNPELQRQPELLELEPYARGWLAEIAISRPEELNSLLRADAAAEQADRDARQFRRNLAFHLVSTPSPAEHGVASEFLDASCALVGPEAYVALARRFLH